MKRTSFRPKKNAEKDRESYLTQDQEERKKSRSDAAEQQEKNRLDQAEAPSREDWEGGGSQPRTNLLRSVAVGLLLAALGWMSSPAWANLIQGEITEVNADSQSLRIARSDPSTLAVEPESILVHVGAETVLKGFFRLEELREGDEVIAEVTESDDRGVWHAESLQVDKVQIRSRAMPEVKAGEVTPGMEKL